MKRLHLLAVLIATLLSSCTSVSVEPIGPEHRLSSVLIRENPKVAVSDFLDVLVEGFRRNGIKAEVLSPSDSIGDAFEVTYVAYRNWDLKPYLRDATISVYLKGVRIGHASYHLVAGGGLSLMKFAGTKSKMLPVIDELLSKQVRRR